MRKILREAVLMLLFGMVGVVAGAAAAVLVLA